MSTEDLENEVYNDRINDLVHKIEEIIQQADYTSPEAVSAFTILLVGRFAEVEDPDRMYRKVMRLLTDEHDDFMDRIEAGEFDE